MPRRHEKRATKLALDLENTARLYILLKKKVFNCEYTQHILRSRCKRRWFGTKRSGAASSIDSSDTKLATVNMDLVLMMLEPALPLGGRDVYFLYI